MKHLFIFTTLALQFFIASGQTAEKALAALASQHPVEKVFIQYDKTYYVAGETIWFKAYLYNNNKPSSISNNFYLRLCDENGKIISIKKYPVKGATVSGEIQLSDTIQQGYYHVQALSPSMLNSYPDFLYSKYLFVFNPSKNKTFASPVVQKPMPGIRFYPESGNLLAENSSVVAFTAIDSAGQPMQVSGVLKTEDGTKISDFKTLRDGFGKIQFKPVEGKKYVLAVEKNGHTDFYPLPEVKNTGVSLKIENEKGGKLFIVSRGKVNKASFNKIQLVAQMNNMIVFDQEIIFDSYFSVKGHLLTDSMPSGIVQFTVFDSEGKPLAERLSFVDNREYLTEPEIEVQKKGTGPREENIIELHFTEAIQRSLSVSVVDADAASMPTENPLTKLFFTDDLSDVIPNPESFFPNQKAKAEDDVDDLLLTLNWSRFSWQKIMGGEFPKKIYEDDYLLSIKGRLRDGKTNESVSGGSLVLYLDSEDGNNQNFEIKVSPDGSFQVDSLLYFGKGQFYYAYKTEQGKEKTVNITMDRIPADMAIEKLRDRLDEKEFARMVVPKTGNTALIEQRYLSNSSKLSKQKELDPVVVQSSTIKRRPVDEVNEKYTSGTFTSMGKVNLDLINSPENNRALSVFEYVRREIRQVKEDKGHFVNLKNFSLFKQSSGAWYDQQQKTLDSTNANKGGTSPGDKRFIDQGMREGPGEHNIVAVYLNEHPTDISFLKTIRMDEIALIKYFEPGFIGSGSAGPGGTIAIYTKDPVDVPAANIEKLDYVQYPGYSLRKKFVQEDNRVTLFWDPEIYTDDQSKTVKIRFFNNEFTKAYRIVVSGFDAMGRLIHAEKIIGDK